MSREICGGCKGTGRRAVTELGPGITAKCPECAGKGYVDRAEDYAKALKELRKITTSFDLRATYVGAGIGGVVHKGDTAAFVERARQKLQVLLLNADAVERTTEPKLCAICAQPESYHHALSSHLFRAVEIGHIAAQTCVICHGRERDHDGAGHLFQAEFPK